MSRIESLLDRLPGKRLMAVALMEVKVIMSQWLVLCLIMLMLVVVVFTIGLAFTGKSGLDHITVSMHVPPGLKGFDGEKFRGLLIDTNRISIIDYDTPAGVIKSIYNRETKIGLIVHEPEAKYGRYVLDIILDNSNVASSVFFFEVARQSVQSIGFSTSRELLIEIWHNLDSIKANLVSETQRIDGFRQQLEQSEARLLDLNASVNAIDINEMRTLLNDQRERSASIGGKLNEFTADIEEFSGQVGGIKGTIADSREKLESYLGKASDARETLQGYDSQLGDVYDELVSIKQAMGDSAPPEIQQAIDKVYNARQELQSSIATLEAAEADAQNTIVQLDEMDESMDKISEKLSNADESIGSLKSQLDDTFTDFNSMDMRLSSLGGTVDEVKLLINDAMESKKTVDANLTESQALMNDFVDSLGELQGLRPEFLANPVIINKINAYKADKFAMLVPALIAIVIMLTSILLSAVSFIVQKKQGAYTRMAGSTTGNGTIFAGKIMGQIFFASVEACIILIVAGLFFGAPVAGNMLEMLLAIAIASFSFVSVGLFITNFTKSEGTTLLSGLVIMIPMIFLSGLILPTELMSVVIQEIAVKLPLTTSITLLAEVMIKGNSLINLIPEILLLVVSSLIFVFFTMLNKKVD